MSVFNNWGFSSLTIPNFLLSIQIMIWITSVLLIAQHRLRLHLPPILHT